MKKLMKKKVNVFGKKFSVFAILMFAVIGFGSAALVPYLSNVVSADIAIGSPITVEVQTGADINTPWDQSTVQIPSSGWIDGAATELTGVGGLTDNVWFRIENNADVNTGEQYFVMEFKNTDGISVAEVQSILNEITVYDWDHANMAATNKISSIYPSTDSNIEYTITGNIVRVSIPLWLWENANDDTDTIYADVNVEFPLNAFGTYDIKGAVLIARDASFTQI